MYTTYAEISDHDMRTRMYQINPRVMLMSVNYSISPLLN